MNKLLSILLALAIAAVPALAQNSQASTSKSAMQSAGTATKTAAKDTGTAVKSGTTAAADKVTGKIDINSASKDELMKLEGVGDAISAKIIANRPYKTKRDLLTKKIVNQATYNKITDKIIAHAPKADASKPAAAKTASASTQTK